MRNATEELTRHDTDFIAHSNEIFKSIYLFSYWLNMDDV